MKMIKKSFIFVLLLTSFISIKGVLGQSTTTVDVTVDSIFEETTLTNTVSDALYGVSLSFEGNLGSQGGYMFAYFVVNDVVEENLSVNYDFIIKNEMDIKAIFTPNDKHVVLFRDSDGTLLDMEYVLDGATVSDAEVVTPDKPGMVIAANKWDKSLSNVTSNMVITLQYDLDTTDTFSLVVNNGTGDGTYNFNEEVTISAPLTSGGNSFSHFEEDGQVLSRNNEEVITMLGDRTVNAVYTDTNVSDAPFVFISDNLEIRAEYSSFIGRYYVPEGFSLIEYGMISNDTEAFELSTVGIKLHQGEIVNPDTTEYLFSFEDANYVYVRGYLIFKDGDDNIIEIYSDTKACGGEVAGDQLFYETGFEDDSKGSYASATVTLSGETWTMDESLIGNLATDQKNGSNSARMKSGSLETHFTAANISKISFYKGKYGNEDNTTLSIELSTDGIVWTTVDSGIAIGDSWELYEFTLNDTVYTNAGLNSADDHYIRFSHSSSERANIDDIKIYTGGSLTVTNPTAEETLQTEEFSMSVSGMDDTTYTVDNVFTGVCEATDMILGDIPCTATGYNMSVAGTYTVVFSATDFEGYVHTMEYSITVSDAPTNTYDGYYTGADGKTGTELRNFLHELIDDHTVKSYDAVRYLLDDTDKDPNNSSNLIRLYIGDSHSNVWDSGATWNREHVWPKSIGGFESDIAGSDIHALRPAQTNVNSSRGNKIFGEGGTLVNYTTDCYATSTTFEPRDEVKGDVARMIFYMAIRYEGNDGANGNDLRLVYEAISSADGVFGNLDMLIQWHLDDPVDQFELDRNDVIYGIQGNRNPFIDNPEMVELIWERE